MSETKESSRQDTSTNTARVSTRYDFLAWSGGIVFIGLMVIGIMFAGQSAGWNTSYDDYKNSTSSHRFTPEPVYCNETNIKGRHGERCYGRWYYWKLPVKEATSGTRALVWICYSLHQILFWLTVYLAQRQKDKKTKSGSKFGKNLSWYNYALLIGNALFFLIHLGQTHLTYDGLAQDVTLASSEGSVIMMLAVIIVMEYRDRGMVFMWPNRNSTDTVGKRIRLNQDSINVFRKYHGYLISWAMIYTFWYHPMENTWGHVLGFIHAGMIFLQGSLIYTKFHKNRYWRLLNETWVLVHGTFIAFQTRSHDEKQFWPMYFLGFGLILSFTQIFGLKFWKKIHWGFRVIPPVLFFGIALIMCGTGVIRADSPEESSFARLREMFYIPLEIYLLLFALWGLVYAMLVMEKRICLHVNKSDNEAVTDSIDKGNQNIELNHTVDDTRPEDIETNNETDAPERFHLREALGIGGFLLIHAFMIFLSFIIQWTDVSLTNTNIMFILSAVFTVCWSVAVMMLRLTRSSP